MPLGISNVTTITWDNITNITGSGSYPEMAANVNHTVYGGWLYFIILWVLIVIIYVRLQDNIDQPLINLMYAFTAVTIIALFMRVIEIVRYGATIGLITDFQMWIFPILAIVFATINWMIKNRQV